jgi:hypothetical protein
VLFAHARFTPEHCVLSQQLPVTHLLPQQMSAGFAHVEAVVHVLATHVPVVVSQIVLAPYVGSS